ncbi:efflux transporter outer membrane subunit [Sphingomonas sp. Leaf25]|uniref:efflux transporter outer membrane subunit n=1 Tax=Sphingomonas sp. Leaf25 TaxID=1735692 RepID=UPI0006FA1F87|nr:efflux transporter outer membrane subunit [Sphingomonas sp. Leaf25]KQN06461.1 RND transporter [Sphingomonas sp. Leaf25]
MRRFLLLATAGLLAGCTVGPSYSGPPATAGDAVTRGSFVRATDPAFTAAPGLARWWEALSDPLLTRLIDEALADSPTVAQASARIREAEAQLRQQRTANLPALSANATAIGARLPGIDLGQGQGASSSESLQFYNAGLNASWEADLFGGGRRGIEQVRATVGARTADLADAQVSLSAQVAQAYVSLRDLQARITLNDAAAQAQRQQLALLRQRFERGTASRLDLERAQGQLENTTAQTIPLAAQRDEQLGLLAILTGRTPGTLDPVLATPAPVPLPPAQVPIGNPAALIAQRPDVRAAERQLAAGTAAIGVNKAKELPGVRFMGLLGLGGTSVGDVFDLGNLAALAAPSLNWSFLDFGRARAATAASEAQRDGAEAAYRQTVLEALQESETALSRFGNARAQLGRLTQAEATATRAATLNRQRVAAGTATLIDQLDLERQRLSAQIAVSQARAALTGSYIAVNKALGLGWREGE